MDRPLWIPDAVAAQGSNMARLMAHIRDKGLADIADPDGLHHFSISQPEQFWPVIWEFCGVKGDMGAGPYLADGDKMPGASFFPDAKLNYAENLLSHGGGAPALIFFGEDRTRREVSWDALREQVSRAQQAFSRMGVGQGDRVAAMMPNVPETPSC